MNFTLNCQGKLLQVTQPIVMGIVNITPDSFYEQSRNAKIDSIVAQIEKMQTEGASIVDIGAQSTNPNSVQISANEEWERLAPILATIVTQFPNLFFSIDTYYSLVAEKAIAAGVHIVNDISGGEMDTNMIPTVAKYSVPFICMHMQGTPQTMQQNPQYDNVTLTVLDYFIAKKKQLIDAGIKDIIFDVGFGFGKTIDHNFQLLKEMHVFNNILEIPILAGLSRKSMIYKTLNLTANEALNGTTALHIVALQQGAAILRAHDVKEAVECVKLYEKVRI